MEKGGRLWQRKKVYQEKLTPKSSWTITLTGIIQTTKLTKPTRKTAVYRKTSDTILVFLKAKAMVGVTTDHQSVSAEKKKCSFASRENPWRFLSDKYKRQRGSVKLSLPYSSVNAFLQYSCQNLRRSNQRKAQPKRNVAVQQIERHMVRTNLLKRMRKLYKRLPFRCAVNSGIVPR